MNRNLPHLGSKHYSCRQQQVRRHRVQVVRLSVLVGVKGSRAKARLGSWWQRLVGLELRVPTGTRCQVALERWLVPILVLRMPVPNLACDGCRNWGDVSWLLSHLLK